MLIGDEGTAGLASAHNQYMDILLRTCIPGFLYFAAILALVVAMLWRQKDIGFFTGMLGVIIYGLFHETFKGSQGGFLLAVVVGMLANVGRRNFFSASGLAGPGRTLVRLAPYRFGLPGIASRSRP